MSSAGAKPTDRLITSEFVQAVEQDRATNGGVQRRRLHGVGSYYPAITAGSTGADAFNEAFQALNARMATLKNPETGQGARRRGHHRHQRGHAGRGAQLHVHLLRRLARRPHGGASQRAVRGGAAQPFVELLGTLLPFIIIGLILFFFFNQMQKANNSQMSFGKAKTRSPSRSAPT